MPLPKEESNLDRAVCPACGVTLFRYPRGRIQGLVPRMFSDPHRRRHHELGESELQRAFATVDDGANQDCDLGEPVRIERQIDGGGVRDLPAIGIVGAEEDGAHGASVQNTASKGTGDGAGVISFSASFDSAISGIGTTTSVLHFAGGLVQIRSAVWRLPIVRRPASPNRSGRVARAARFFLCGYRP